MGGTPATWTTCLLFFQGALLLGYLYVHLTHDAADRAARRRVVHVLLLTVAVVLSPLRRHRRRRRDSEAPAGGCSARSRACVGAAVRRGGGHGAAPAALVRAALRPRSVFPLRGEQPRQPGRAARLSAAGRAHADARRRSARPGSAAFAALALLIAGCAAVAWRRAGSTGRAESAAADVTTPPAGLADRVWWLLLALVPSSLLLGVTAHISTDVAAVPLLWVVPLALYLLTFIDRVRASGRRCRAAGRRGWRRWRSSPRSSALAVGTSWSVGLGAAPHRVRGARAGVPPRAGRPASRRRAPDRLLPADRRWRRARRRLQRAGRAAVFTADQRVSADAGGGGRAAAGARRGAAAALEPLALVVGVPIVVFAVLVGGLDVGTGRRAAASAATRWASGWSSPWSLVATNRRAGVRASPSPSRPSPTSRAARSTDGRVIFAARSFFGVHRVVEN